jgi:hydroxymethylpyrimidine pyrophosphatase-like HAD family hydrolase
MRHVVFAVDYDGTLATHGVVDNATVAALARLKKSGRRLVLVTGRELEDLIRIFADVDLFDRVVAENGAVVYSPADRQSTTLGEPPPAAFVEALRSRGVVPLSTGHVIVATWEPNQMIVLDAIRTLGLELQVIFNKGAVMVLPPGINKATGLERALSDLGLSPHNTVGIGDAENDHAFLSLCECAIAVANALPGLKARADWTTSAPRGAGVIEAIDRLMAADLADVARRCRRHRLTFGDGADGSPLMLDPHGTIMLIAGPSGSGKSTVATAILERLIDGRYQACLVDPEGDYANFAPAIVLGDNRTAPTVTELVDVLRRPSESVVAVLLGVGLDDRPGFLDPAVSAIETLLKDTGRPHWVVLDEAHHLLPANAGTARSLPAGLDSAMLITVHPDHLPADVLARVNLVVAVGPAPWSVMRTFASSAGVTPPDSPQALEAGEALAWFTHDHSAPIGFRPASPHLERLRHKRKYAEGTLGPDKSFYFQGPANKLHLRAQNFELFLQLAEGVDDETWLHHLRRGDYSAWVHDAIKDDELATEIAAIESAEGISATDSRAAIADAIGKRYTRSS